MLTIECQFCLLAKWNLIFHSQLHNLPVKRLTYIRVTEMPKFVTTSLLTNWSFSLLFGLFKVTPLTP